MESNFREPVFEEFVFQFFKIFGRKVVFGVGEDAIFQGPEGDKEVSDGRWPIPTGGNDVGRFHFRGLICGSVAAKSVRNINKVLLAFRFRGARSIY